MSYFKCYILPTNTEIVKQLQVRKSYHQSCFDIYLDHLNVNTVCNDISNTKRKSEYNDTYPDKKLHTKYIN